MPGNCTLWFRLDEFLWRVYFSITSPTTLNSPPKARQIFLIFAVFFPSFAYAELFPTEFYCLLQIFAPFSKHNWSARQHFWSSLGPRPFVLRAAPFWAILRPFQGQDRFGAKLICFQPFGDFPGPRLFRGQLPRPCGSVS